MTAAARGAGGKNKEGGGFAAAHLQGAPRQATEPLLRPPGCCASRWRATALRAALDPGDLGGPGGQEERSGPGPAPGQARGTRGRLAGGCGTQTPGNKVNWRSTKQKKRKIT